MKRLLISCSVSVLTMFTAGAAPKAGIDTWTRPDSALREDPDFSIQGEYLNRESESPMGAQVVALGGGKFDIYLLEGGLPGAGWEPGKPRTLFKGGRSGDEVVCKEPSGGATVTISRSLLYLTKPDGTKQQLMRTERQSPTLGAKPPSGAIVLFDGTSAAHWENGKVEDGFLLSTGCTSKQRFTDYTLHVEFRTPYMPQARGQQRGNSGIYHSGRWETQILDSFGLDGKDNECGGIYSISKPRLNMCLPPLAWQTYDVQFRSAQFDSAGKRTAWPRITVRLNGVLVHEDLELNKDFTTAAPIHHALAEPSGPVFLQDHQNPVVFRNIWILPDGKNTNR